MHVVQPYSISLVTTEVDKSQLSHWEQFIPRMFRGPAEERPLDDNWNYLANKRYLIRAEILDQQGHKVLPSPALVFEVTTRLIPSGPTADKSSK